MKTTIDYETRSALNLKLVGPIEYAKHESTSILCVAYKRGNGRTKLWIPERGPMPERLWQAFQDDVLNAHNAGFEMAITRYCLTRYDSIKSQQRTYLSHLPIYRWTDTAARAAMMNLPRSLEAACNALDIPVKKDMEGNRLMKKYMKPRKPSKHNPDLWWSDRNELRHIYRYCMIDVEAQHLLDKELPELSDTELDIWQLDQVVNARGVRIDIPTVKLILKLIDEEKLNLKRETFKLTKGEVASTTQGAKLLEWVNQRGADMDNLRAGTIRDKLEDETLNGDVRRVLAIRQAASKTSTAKYKKMVQAVGADHRARELLLYAGATPTARWTGKRIQPQNFPRPNIKAFDSNAAIELIKTRGLTGVRDVYGPTKVMDVFASALRGMLIASEHYELFCADFASVELNLAFWITDYKWGLDALKEKRKMYEEMAEAIFGIPWQEISKESIERFIGKETMLGAQYGMGWKRFLQSLHDKGKKEITPHMAKKAINTYRKKHSVISDYWADLESTIIEAIKYPGNRYTLTKLKIFVDDKNYLNIRLPSGRCLKYYKPRVSSKRLESGRMVPQIHHWEAHPKFGFVEVVNWGGTFFNHIVQGTARDFMAHGACNIEDAGFKFLLSVHDEAIAEAPKGTRTLTEFIKLMAHTPPAWGRDAPISAEGWIDERYKK